MLCIVYFLTMDLKVINLKIKNLIQSLKHLIGLSSKTDARPSSSPKSSTGQNQLKSQRFSKENKMENYCLVEFIEAKSLIYHRMPVPLDLVNNCFSEMNVIGNHDVYVMRYNNGHLPCFMELQKYIEQRVGFVIEPYIKRIENIEITKQ